MFSQMICGGASYVCPANSIRALASKQATISFTGLHPYKLRTVANGCRRTRLEGRLSQELRPAMDR